MTVRRVDWYCRTGPCERYKVIKSQRSQAPLQGRSQDFEKGEANVTEGGAEGTYI